MGLFYKQKQDKFLDFESLSGDDMIYIVLKKLVAEGKFNEGENFLFEEAKKNITPRVFNIGTWFYETLNEKEDEELLKANFTREEIEDGLKDFKKIFKTMNK